MHELDDEPGNAIKLKIVDLVALIGLGLIGVIATAASSILTGLSKRIVHALDLEGTWLANWGISLLSIVVGIAAGAVLFLYMQTALPRIILPRKVAAIAALAGGIVFYLAQRLGNLYVGHVIGTNAAYGALAVPLALLVWIYLMTRAIMVIAAWTKEATLDARAAEQPDPVEADTVDAVDRVVEPEPLLLGPPGKRYKVVPIPERKADTVAVAAGAVLGATLTTLAVQTVRAVRAVRRP
jgi:membrane protein